MFKDLVSKKINTNKLGHNFDLKNVNLIKKNIDPILLRRNINVLHIVNTCLMHFFISPISIKSIIKEYKILTFADDIT